MSMHHNTQLAYAPSSGASRAQSRSVRLLIAGALWQLAHAANFFGFYWAAQTIPSIGAAPVRILWIYNRVSLNEILGGLIHAANPVTSTSGIVLLLLFSAWSVNRRYDWGLFLGTMLSCLVSAGFGISVVFALAEFLFRTLSIFKGARDIGHIDLIWNLWGIGLGIILLCATRGLWALILERHAALRKEKPQG